MKLTGAGGVGKTAVTKALRRRLTGTLTAWSGITGKAALRLKDVLQVDTRTTYSVLYAPPREVDNVEDAKIDLHFDEMKTWDGVDNDSLLVIDEGSMIGPKLRSDLEKSPYKKILIIGDSYQLSPVLSKAEEAQVGEDYSVFSTIEGPHLNKVMRNGGAVLAAATMVREQQRIQTDSGDFDGSSYNYVEIQDPSVVVNAGCETWLADREGHVLIAWKNDTRNLANTIIRHRLGYTSVVPVAGEPLVIRKNIYKLGLMNGDIVKCEEVGEEGPTLAGVPTRWLLVREETSGRLVEVLAAAGDFTGVLPYVGLETWKKALKAAKVDDVCPLTFAYSLTAHLAQGSQYRRVTVVSPGDFRSPHFNKMTKLPDGTQMPFSMRWAYTSLSRAVKRSSLILSR